MARLIEPPTREQQARSGRPHDPQTDGRPAVAAAAGPTIGILRVAAAGLVIATGAIHLYLYQDYFSSVPTIGRLFVANFVTAIVLGGVVLLRPRLLWAALGAAFCLATLAAFLISVHWGLFGYRETLRGAWQERAAVVEILGAIACGWLAGQIRLRST
jgi:hypothetical protein